MTGTRNSSINGAKPALNLAGARRPKVATQPDALALADSILRRIDREIRVAQLVAARHQVTGCPTPGACPPCATEERRQWTERDAEQRQAAIAQHAISAARLRQRPVPASVLRQRRFSRDAALIERTHAIAGAGAQCQVCRTTDAGRTCRACGSVHASQAEVDDVNRPAMSLTYSSTTPASDIRAAKGMLARMERES
jgi:hypothetical protein